MEWVTSEQVKAMTRILQIEEKSTWLGLFREPMFAENGADLGALTFQRKVEKLHTAF